MKDVVPVVDSGRADVGAEQEGFEVTSIAARSVDDSESAVAGPPSMAR